MDFVYSALASLLFLAPGVALVVVLIVGVARGLYLAPAPPFQVRIAGEILETTKRTRRRTVAMARIARARYAFDDGWTRSTVVVDALTLYDARGWRLAKIPATADGWEPLMAALRTRGVAISEVVVDAPSVLD